MMTERDKQLAAAYIPSPRDPELDVNEYYVMDLAGRVQKVFVTRVFPGEHGEEVYVVAQSNTRRYVNGWVSSDGLFADGFIDSDLYDNKQDCKNQTHPAYGKWRDLRRKQQEV